MDGTKVGLPKMGVIYFYCALVLSKLICNKKREKLYLNVFYSKSAYLDSVESIRNDGPIYQSRSASPFSPSNLGS